MGQARNNPRSPQYRPKEGNVPHPHSGQPHHRDKTKLTETLVPDMRVLRVIKEEDGSCIAVVRVVDDSGKPVLRNGGNTYEVSDRAYLVTPTGALKRVKKPA